MQLHTLAAYQPQWTKIRKSQMEQDSKRQRLSNTDINSTLAPRPSLREISKTNEAVIAPDGERLMQAPFRKGAARRSLGEGYRDAANANPHTLGPHLETSSADGGDSWIRSRGAEFEETPPEPSSAAWTTPLYKLDGRGQVYCWSGRMNGGREVWTTTYADWAHLKGENMRGEEDISHFEYDFDM